MVSKDKRAARKRRKGFQQAVVSTDPDKPLFDFCCVDCGYWSTDLKVFEVRKPRPVLPEMKCPRCGGRNCIMRSWYLTPQDTDGLKKWLKQPKLGKASRLWVKFLRACVPR
jgi:hypothetical protein